MEISKSKPKIFVFCNSCAPQWYSATALSENGVFLSGHICSSHGFIYHDMGVDEDGWKRDIYAKYYPDGFEVVFVESDVKDHPGIQSAMEKHRAMTREEYEKKLEAIKDEPREPGVEIVTTESDEKTEAK